MLQFLRTRRCPAGETARRPSAKRRACASLSASLLAVWVSLSVGASLSETRAQTGSSRAKGAKPQATTSESANRKGTDDRSLEEARRQFIQATQEYRASLNELLSLYQTEAKRAEEKQAQLQELYAQGLISRRALEEGERTALAARAKIEEVRRQMANAEAQIAAALLEAEEAKREAQRSSPARAGTLIRTAALTRYNGFAPWSLADAPKVQRFYQERFGRPLPVSAYGQSPVHDQWGLDHRNSLDVPVHPDSAEGQALMSFLRANGIPFLAFRTAIPGAATGPHIHIGYPSRALRR